MAVSAKSIQALLGNPALGLRTAEAVLGRGRLGAAGEGRQPQPLMDRDADSPASPGLTDWLAAGGVHEWFLAWAPEAVREARRAIWYAPLTLLALLAAGRGQNGADGEGAAEKAGSRKKIVWIGRACWPTFQLLCAALGGAGAPASGGELARRCVFLDPLSDEERFWGIGQVLRCPGVGAVVADGSRMDATVSRRLQLAAEAGGVLALLARPPWEQGEPSWAMTRWQVRPCLSHAMRPRWDIELVYCKGWQPGQEAPRRWRADWSYEVFGGTGTLHLSAPVGC